MKCWCDECQCQPAKSNDRVWVCLDCADKECSNTEHAWAEAELVEREDGTEAWFYEPLADDVPVTIEPTPAPSPQRHPAFRRSHKHWAQRSYRCLTVPSHS